MLCSRHTPIDENDQALACWPFLLFSASVALELPSDRVEVNLKDFSIHPSAYQGTNMVLFRQRIRFVTMVGLHLKYTIELTDNCFCRGESPPESLPPRLQPKELDREQIKPYDLSLFILSSKVDCCLNPMIFKLQDDAGYPNHIFPLKTQ
ncbi:hypothetical protein RF11_13887 [Thelohanellus kitauei]|uniref:Uncharacterized protein n=1 Tax=Thelohanellus kitauei TaxID=669202 RepID=A0A0C2M1G1_THEKT|nr:hypothetical protein RF11_13887 [Thelohanellus kitauei]